MNEMEALVKKYHSAQTRNKGAVPYLEHLFGVADIACTSLCITGECKDGELLRDIYNAAWGHDLLEDTHVSEDEVIGAANERTLELIKELTNPVDDEHTDEYMRRLSADSEEARIVKYCDLIENTTSVFYALQVLGSDWLQGFYLPIPEKTTATLAGTDFESYPKTAELLRSMLNVRAELLATKAGMLQLYGTDGS